MNRKQSNEIVRWMPIPIANAAAVAALIATALSALLTTHPGFPASDPPLGNALAVARTYAFRHALRNSALVAIAVGLAVFALARVIQPRVGEVRRTRPGSPRWR